MFKNKLKMLTVSDRVFFILIILSALSIFFVQTFRNDTTIKITYNSTIIGEYDSNSNQTITLPDNHGVVEILKGKARLTKSDCHSHLCEKQGWSTSLPIVCVPNRILIEFIPKKKKEEIIILH
ncbi:MAG: NusG domain II-containing protein [Candidatus Zophobacter franzmannii]|nr:NusG domain II-containing protein [Candidatus Zophobacter franzmannii]